METYTCKQKVIASTRLRIPLSILKCFIGAYQLELYMSSSRIIILSPLILSLYFLGATLKAQPVKSLPSQTANSTLSLNQSLFAIDPPALEDIQLCGTSPQLIELPIATDEYVWWDDSLGGSIINVGREALLMPEADQADTSFYISLAGKNELGIVGLDSFRNGVFGNSPRGLLFDVFEPIILDSVSVFADRPLSLTIVLKNEQGNIIASREVNVENGGGEESVVPVGFQIPAGSNYSLESVDMFGGNLSVENSNVTYPYSLGSSLNITESSNGFLIIYYYFYNWKVSELDLDNASDRTTLQVDFLPTPNVDLGKDSSICGDDYLLSIPDEGVSYSWNTGETSNELLVTESGQYFLTASIGPCIASDSVEVVILGAPPEPNLSDTTVCTSDSHNIILTDNNFGYTWWRSSDSEIPFSFDKQISENIADTTIFFIESNQSIFEGSVGIPKLENAGFDAAPRGLVFNTEKLIKIDTVDLYLNGSGDITIELWNDQDSVLYSKTVFLESKTPEPNMVPLDFIVPEGSGYQLLCTSFSPGMTLAIENQNVSFPYVLDDLVTITTTNSGFFSIYYYLYNWRISSLVEGCSSERFPLQVNVKIPLELQKDTYSCEDLIIGGENPDLQYQWSTGESSNLITVSETGLYSVLITDGQDCVLEDSTFIEIPIPVGLPKDGILCGNLLTTNYGAESSFNWSTGQTSTEVNISSPGQYIVQIEEPRGCLLADTVLVSGFDSFPAVDLGLDVGVCDSIILDAGADGIDYLWSTGATTRNLTVISTGLYIVEVTNENSCTSTDSVAILVSRKPDPAFTFQVNGFQVSFSITSEFAQYTWDFGDGNTQSILNPVHFYQDTGTYTVSLIGSNSCGIDTTTQEIVISGSTVSNEELIVEESWKVFPNPIQDRFTVEFDKSLLQEEGILSVYNSIGEEVYASILNAASGTSQEIYLPNLTNGIYFVTLKIGAQYGVRRIVRR